MNFNKHLDLEGKHAFLGASNYHWLGYDEQKLIERYINHQALERGTELHEFAAKAIKLKIKLSKTKQTLNMYVNDAIGYGMTPEQPLYYSPNCFGTADSIFFNGKLLRIHDLKTGAGRTDMKQLKIYAALFCLEYAVNPIDIHIELRIYQNDECKVCVPNPEEILGIMNTIVNFDRVIEQIKKEG